MDRFRERIRQSISNSSLQAALDANTERRLTVRANALASLPDWESRRQRAHRVRADVIERLDDYFARPGLRLGQVAQLELSGRAVSNELYGFHFRSLRQGTTDMEQNRK